MFLHRHKGMGRFFPWNSKAEKWAARRRPGECPQWIVTSYPLSNNRQKKAMWWHKAFMFSWKQKQTGKWGTKGNADGNYKKAHHWWILEESQTLFHASFSVALVLQQSLSHWLSCWRPIKCYTGEWPSWARKATEQKEKGLELKSVLREIAVKKPEEDKRWAR